MSQASAAEGSHVGRLLAGRYRLVRLVGTGGMGSVYEAVHVHTDKRVAIKLLSPGLSKDLKLVARFRREAMAASRLEHENCVHVDDFGEDADGTFFIVMELIDGRGLADELRKTGPMAPTRVANLAMQLLKALDVAHAGGVLHRDLKPQNVMLTDKVGRSDIVKVVDFGIAKLTTNSPEDQGALTVPGTIFGTPEYMSPEQARGEALDVRSDLYSAAVVLWHLLLGRSPFRGASVRETLLKVFSEEPPSPASVGAPLPPAFEAVLRKGMSKRKEDRYPDAGSFLEAIAPFVDAPLHELPRRALPGLPADGSAPPTTIDDQHGTTRPVVASERTPMSGTALPEAQPEAQPAAQAAAPQSAMAHLPTQALPETEVLPPMPKKGVPAGMPVDKSTRVVSVDSVRDSADSVAAAGQGVPAQRTVVQQPLALREQAEIAHASEAARAAEPTAVPTPAYSARRGLSPVGRAVLIVATGVLAALAVGGALLARSLATKSAAPTQSVSDEAPQEAAATVSSQPAAAAVDERVDEAARDAALARAEAALAADDLPAALTAYEEAWRADRGSAKAMQGVATVAMRLKDHHRAAAALERLMAIDEKSRRAFGPLHAREKQLAEASD